MKKLLIFIVAYNAETTIAKVIGRIPYEDLNKDFILEVLIIDDQSSDSTFRRAIEETNKYPFKINVLVNPKNLMYGGNQKVGYQYAINNSFDYVALIHGDGQYAPEVLPILMKPLNTGQADAVFGSRMLTRGGAIKGGMPLYKFVGNKILTRLQNFILSSSLSEFHSGYRIYSVEALKEIPFELNTNDFHFDTEIIIQLFLAKKRIAEIAIPTYYGDEICRVNGIKYASDVILVSIRSALQKYGFLYDDKFHVAKDLTNLQYKLKLGYLSTHTMAIDAVESGSKVLDIGCAGGYIGKQLMNKGCQVTGIDCFDLQEGIKLNNFIKADLNAYEMPKFQEFNYILMLDIIEHLNSPEMFIKRLRIATSNNPALKIIVTTGNIGFIIQRLLLLVGIFNYGEKGILDRDHKRLFTFSTLKKLFSQYGFEIISTKGVPAPFPLVFKNNCIAKILLSINKFLIRFLPTLFSFQIYIEVKPKISIDYLLRLAVENSNYRKEDINRLNE
jgi:glycosyltransferase involved in cell wall biosynthesis